METEILKHFINRDVEILVSGVWIEGHMKPIVKGVITLVPLPEMAAFFGPTAVKSEVVQAIREIKRSGQKMADPVPEATDKNVGAVRSSMEQITPGQRFRGKS